MPRQIQINLPESTHAIEVNGKTHVVRLAKTGVFVLNGGYRGTPISERTLEQVRRRIAELDTDAKEKAEKAKRRASGQTSIPALHGPNLDPIQIRGVHSVTGKILVTFADGTKDSLHKYANILRVLTPEEVQEVKEARKAARITTARREATKGPDHYSISKEFGETIELDVTYDADAETFSATLANGVVLSGESVNEVELQVLPTLIAERYAFRTDDAEVHPTTPDNVRGTLFNTREAAEAYIAAVDADEFARAALQNVLDKYRLDLSVFRG